MLGASAQGRFRLLGWTLGLFAMSITGLCLLSLLLTVVAAMSVWAGIPPTLWTVDWMQSFADWHRTRFARLSGVEIPRPYRSVHDDGWLGRLRTVSTDPANWRDTAWLAVNGTAGAAVCLMSITLFLAGVFYVLQPAIWALAPGVFNTEYGLFTVHDEVTSFGTVPLGVASLALWWWRGGALIRADARLGRWLLAPTERSRLADRISELAQSRAETLDTQAAELRRIERDLHDGAQARIVGLGMSLGMADELLDSDTAAARKLLAEARADAGAALSDLRALVRGIHPPVLADRGLDGAIQALALAAGVPVAVAVSLPGRLPPPVESAAYFAMAEALANVVKHSGARTAWIQARHAAGRLSVIVGDDGHGGAVLAPGSGLDGIERRLRAFDGTLSLSSPPGGPTVMRMEVPCGLS